MSSESSTVQLINNSLILTTISNGSRNMIGCSDIRIQLDFYSTYDPLFGIHPVCMSYFCLTAIKNKCTQLLGSNVIKRKPWATKRS